MAIRDTINLLTEDEPLELLDTFRSRRESFDEPATLDLASDPEAEAQDFADMPQEPVEMPPDETERAERRRQAMDEFYSDPTNIEGLQENDDELPGEGVGLARFRPSAGEEYGIGLRRGGKQLQGLAGGFIGLVSDALGIEAGADWGLEQYRSAMEEAAESEAFITDPFEQIDGIGDAGLYAAGLLGEQTYQLMSSVLGAGIGYGVGRSIANRVIANEIGKRTAAGLTKEAAEKAVRDEVTENALRVASIPVSEKGFSKGGAITGAYLTNFGMISGGTYGQIEEETGLRDPGTAAAFSAGGAALDTLGEVFLASKFLKPFSRGVEAKPGISLPAKPRTVGGVARSAGLGALTGGAVEGGVEGAQTGIEQAAVGAADPDQTIGERLAAPGASRERAIAAAAGFTVGGALGGPGGVLEALAPKTAQKIRDKGTQENQEQEQPAPSELPGDWSETITVGGLPMRYSEAIDQWAVVNPPENFPNTTNLADGTRVYLVPERTSSGQALSQAARARLSALRGENVEGIEDFTEDEQQEEEGEETELTPFSANTPVLFKPFDGDTQLKAIVRGYDADGNAEIDVFDPENVLGAPEGKARTNLAPWWSEKSGLTQPERTQPENVGEIETARGGLSIGPRIVARREVVSKDQLGRLALDAEAQLTDEQRQRQETLKAELLARRAKPGLDVSDDESSVDAEQEQIDEAQQRDRGESEAFINSLDPGTPVSVIRFNPEGRTTLGRNDGQRFEDAFFLRRLSNGNALFQLRPVRRADQRTSEVPPKGGSREQLEPGVEFQGASPRKEFVAERTANMIELKPSEFNLVTFRGLPTSRPANPIDDQINDIVAALGGNPSGQELAAALGTIYEGPGFPTRSFFRDGVATGNNPGIGIRWRNKRDGSPEKVGQSYGIFGLRWMGEEGTAGRPEKVEMPQIPRKQRQGEDRAAAAERYGREMGTYKNTLDGLALNTLRQMDRGLVVEVEGGFEVERMLRDPLRTFELEQIPDTRRATYQEPSKSGRSTVTRTRPRRFRVTAVRWRGNIARQGKNPLDFSISAALDPLSPEAESRARQQLKETGETDYRPSQVAGTQRGLGILKDIYRFDLRRREQSETAQGTSQTSLTRLLQQSRMTDAQLREAGKTREQVEKELADLGTAIVERPDVGIGKLREFAQRTQSGRYEFVATSEARLRAIELSGGREPNKAQLDRAIDETLAAENLTRDEVITALTEFDKSVEFLASLDPDARNVVEKLLTDVDNYVNASRQVPTRTPGTARADILDLALVRAKNTRLRDIRMAIERAKKKGGRPIQNLSVRDRGNIMRLYLEALDEIRAERADKRVQAEETKIYGGTRGRSDQIQQLLAEAREAGIQDAATILDRKTPIDKARRLIAEARRGMRRTERSVAPGAGQAQRLMRDIENVVERGGVSGVPDAKSVFERMEALVESGAIPQAKKDLVRTNLLNETQANLEKDFKEAKARVIKKLENDQSRYRDEPARDVFPREKTSKSGKSIAAKRVPARRVLTVPTAQIRAEYDYLENIPKVFGDLLKKNPFFTVVDAVRSAARSLESQQRLGRAESMPQGEPAPAQSQQELLEETNRPDRFGMDAPNFARREYWRRVEDLDNVFGNGARALLFRGFGLTESGKRAVTQGKANQFYRAFLEMTETGKLSPKTLRRWSARKNFPAGDRARFIRILDYLIDPNQYGRRTAQPAARAVGASTQPLTVAQPGVAGDPRTQRGVAPRPDSGPITRGLSAEQLMAGTGESRPEGSARQDGVGGPVGAGGTAASGPGTVRDGAAGGVRGPGIRVASQPRTIRTLSRAATRRLVGLAGRSAGLTDAELAAIPDEEIRRAYVALMTTADQTATLAGRNAIGQSPVPMAERFTQTGEQLLTAAAKENADYMANKQRVDRLRQNIGLALRARAFGNPSEFFKAVAADNQQPANLRMLAKEFLKLQGRGLDIDGVALQVGAFGRNFNSDPITEKEIKSKIRLKDGVYTVSTSAGKVTHSGTPDTNPEGRARATAIRDIQMSRAAKFAGRATRQQTALGDDAVFDTGAYALYINLDAPHPNGSPVGTVLHEFNHVVLDAKIDGLIELNPTERAALERLRAERRAAVIEAARRLDIDLPSNPSEAEIDSASQQIYQLAETITPEQLDALGIDNARALDALTSDREFANDIISRPDVADLLVNLGRGKAGGKPTTLLGAIRKAWDALVELISGVKADPNSPLARAFKDSWTLVYASNGAEMDDTSFTMPEVMRSELAAEMQTQAEVNAFIERELDRRNLAGTAEERNRLLSEFRKETEPEAPAQEEGATEEDTEIDEEEQLRLARQRVLRAMGMEGREDDPEVSAFDPDVVSRAVEVMSENEFVQWAQANGFQFLDPRAVYRNTILEKAIRDAGKPPVPKQKQKQAKAEPKKEDDDTDPPPPPPGGKPPRKPPTQTPPGKSQAPPTPAPPPQRRDRGTLGVTPLTPKARAKKLLDSIPEENRGQFKTSKGDVQAGTRIYKRSRAKDGSLKETRSGEVSQSVHFVTRVVGDKVFTLPAITFDSGSRSAQWNDQQEYSQKDFQDLVKKGDIEVETDPALPVGRSVYSPEEGRMISVMPAATQIDPDATAGAAPVNENAPDFVDVPPSESRIEAFRPRVIEPVTKKTYTGGTYTMKGILRSVFEYLDPRAGDMWLKSRAAIKAEASRVDDLADILKKQLSELKKQGQEFSSDLLNTALGNLENPLTTDQIREIESLSGGRTTFTGEDGETYTTDPAGELRDEYLRANRNAFRAKQRLALKELPENVASTIAEMSAHIESLSKKLPKEGIVHGDLKITVDEALGIYLNRSYAIFDDPKWADKVKKNAPVIAAARRYIKNQLVKDKASELFSIAQESGSPISKEEALRRAGEVVIDDDVETALESYLSVGLDAPSIGILSGRIPGQKNLSILYNRKNIAPEIQALWGRYDDPTINYAKSVLKLASLVSNHQFLKELRAEGLKEGWLWDPNSNTEKPVGFQRIASEKNRSLEPLAGMYAMPEFLRGLETVFSPDTLESHNYLMRYLTKATGITMGMQTVGSYAAQVRNYLGNFLKLLATGNLGLGDIANPEWRKNLAFAHRAAIADVFKSYGKQDRKFWRNEIDKLIRLGVFGESITTNLIDDLVGLSKAATDGQFDNKFNQIIGRPAMQIAKLAQDTYAAGDNIFKAMIFFSERAKYAKAMPELDKQNVDAELGITDLDRKAAQISRDIHWTYSLAPQIVQDLKRGPGVFIAPFITFTTEVIRTTINTFNLARQEIRDGRASGNQDLEAIGWGRIRGLTAAALLPSAVGAGIAAMFGNDGEDEENLRRFLPDWQKNNQLVMLGNENGKISFIDMSFLDPHEYFKKPLKAFWRSLTDDDATATERISGSVISAVGEILNPFTSEQIFAGAIADVARNRDEAGRQVWNPQDTAARKGMAVANHIFIQPFMPGTGRSLGRIGAAALGWQGDTGRAYSLPNELASMFLGQRISQVDVNQALGFSVNRFLRGQRDASTLFTREFTSEGTRSPAGIVSSYDRANEAHLSLVSQMRKDYKAALGLGGMTVDSTRRKMKEAGMGKESIKEVTTGIFTPYQASKEMVDSVRRRGLNDRINAYEQARDMVPQREVLQ